MGARPHIPERWLRLVLACLALLVGGAPAARAAEAAPRAAVVRMVGQPEHRAPAVTPAPVQRREGARPSARRAAPRRWRSGVRAAAPAALPRYLVHRALLR
jgi:hypothetical protein